MPARGSLLRICCGDHPFRHPVAYTYLYYVHYPALSGVLHWPPLFYLWEGLVFLVLGASVVTARISILLLAAVALWVWFRMVEELESDPGGRCGDDSAWAMSFGAVV